MAFPTPPLVAEEEDGDLLTALGVGRGAPLARSVSVSISITWLVVLGPKSWVRAHLGRGPLGPGPGPHFDFVFTTADKTINNNNNNNKNNSHYSFKTDATKLMLQASPSLIKARTAIYDLAFSEECCH